MTSSDVASSMGQRQGTAQLNAMPRPMFPSARGVTIGPFMEALEATTVGVQRQRRRVGHAGRVVAMPLESLIAGPRASASRASSPPASPQHHGPYSASPPPPPSRGGGTGVAATGGGGPPPVAGGHAPALPRMHSPMGRRASLLLGQKGPPSPPGAGNRQGSGGCGTASSGSSAAGCGGSSPLPAVRVVILGPCSPFHAAEAGCQAGSGCMPMPGAAQLPAGRSAAVTAAGGGSPSRSGGSGGVQPSALPHPPPFPSSSDGGGEGVRAAASPRGRGSRSEGSAAVAAAAAAAPLHSAATLHSLPDTQPAVLTLGPGDRSCPPCEDVLSSSPGAAAAPAAAPLMRGRGSAGSVAPLLVQSHAPHAARLLPSTCPPSPLRAYASSPSAFAPSPPASPLRACSPPPPPPLSAEPSIQCMNGVRLTFQALGAGGGGGGSGAGGGGGGGGGPGPSAAASPNRFQHAAAPNPHPAAATHATALHSPAALRVPAAAAAIGKSYGDRGGTDGGGARGRSGTDGGFGGGRLSTEGGCSVAGGGRGGRSSTVGGDAAELESLERWAAGRGAGSDAAAAVEAAAEAQRKLVRLAQLRDRVVAAAAAAQGGAGGARQQQAPSWTHAQRPAHHGGSETRDGARSPAGAGGAGSAAAVPTNGTSGGAGSAAAAAAAAANGTLAAMAAQVSRLAHVDPALLRDPHYRCELQRRVERLQRYELHVPAGEAAHDLPLNERLHMWRPSGP